MHQKSVSEGILLSWAKTYKCPGVEGEDVVNLLMRQCEKRNLPVNITAILNDTTGWFSPVLNIYFIVWCAFQELWSKALFWIIDAV